MNNDTSNKTGQRFEDKERTKDVLTGETVEFKDLHLSDQILSGLTKSEFKRPSPIQLKAIPYGRCGLDLIVQAKSGTGKTCVFTVVALESVVVEKKTLQVIMLAPTREIALQICDVVRSIGQDVKGLNVGVFIGGIPLSEDKKSICDCQIAIASPGRMKQLIEMEIVSCKNVRLFVLDEADKLLNEESFQQQINWIFSMLPTNKQIIAASATYPENLALFLKNYMRNPTFVRLNMSDMALVGLQQYFVQVKNFIAVYKNFEAKISSVTDILTSRQFTQALVFSNYHSHAKSLCEACISSGFSATYISGGMDQLQRIEAITKLKQFQCRVLISTDLTSRGIDSHNVDIVINMDIPEDWETYLHRIGRAGRFGARGVAISIACEGHEMDNLMNIVKICNMEISSYSECNSNTTPNSLHSAVAPAVKDDAGSVDVQMKNLNVTTYNLIEETVEHEVPLNNNANAEIRLPSLPDVVTHVMFSKTPSLLSLLTFEELSEDFDHFIKKREFKVWNEKEIYKRIPVEDELKSTKMNKVSQNQNLVPITSDQPPNHKEMTKVVKPKLQSDSVQAQSTKNCISHVTKDTRDAVPLVKTYVKPYQVNQTPISPVVVVNQANMKHSSNRKLKEKNKSSHRSKKRIAQKTTENTNHETESENNDHKMLLPQFSQSAEKEYWKNVKKCQRQYIKQQKESQRQWTKYCKSVMKYYQQNE